MARLRIYQPSHLKLLEIQNFTEHLCVTLFRLRGSCLRGWIINQGPSERTHVTTNNKALPVLAVLAATCFLPSGVRAQTIPNGAAIDAEVNKLMTRTSAKGMAVAVIDHGKVGYVHAYGIRNAKGDPLTADTVMYGASLTKTVFAYTVMQLVDQGKLKLDAPIKDDLDKPLPSYGPDPVFPDKYGPYKDLADDPRWEKITPRMALTHSTGFSNFWFIEPDQKLHIHFEPSTHFSYSGEGFILLQFVVEHGRKAQGLGLDVGDLTKAIFDRLGMHRTSLVWRIVRRPMSPTGGTIRASRSPMTSAARCAWRAR